MSYNSRRQTRSTAAPPTQVTYHQNTPGRPAVPSTPQQQQYQTPTTPYQQQQQTPIQAQQTPQTQPDMQQQQVQQTTPVYKSPVVQTTPVKPAQPQAPQTNPQAAVAVPKVESLEQDKNTAAPGQGGDTEMEPEGGETKKWTKRPKPLGYKVNKVLQRRRKNARFRKLLTPKNAIMVLNELQPGVAFESQEVTNAFNQTTYIVSFEVDGQQFHGEGTSKGAAKQAAAEAAVKSLILRKIADSKRKEEGVEAMDTSENTEESQSEAGEGATNGGKRRELPEDEVPWGSLASFALFRLFNEWESQGTYVPFPPGTLPKSKLPMGTVTPVNPIPRAPKKPANPAAMQGTHPVTLVGRLWPGSIFTEVSRDGQPPNMTFIMGVTIDGKSFTGSAKNKKDAKKECAKAALSGMGVQWDEQQPMPSVQPMQSVQPIQQPIQPTQTA